MATAVSPPLPRKRKLIAANIRARAAWLGLDGKDLSLLVGCSHTGMNAKLRAASPFTADELDVLAEVFGLPDPGPFYLSVPTFPDEPGPLSAPGSQTPLYFSHRLSRPNFGVPIATRAAA